MTRMSIESLKMLRYTLKCNSKWITSINTNSSNVQSTQHKELQCKINNELQNLFDIFKRYCDLPDLHPPNPDVYPHLTPDEVVFIMLTVVNLHSSIHWIELISRDESNVSEEDYLQIIHICNELLQFHSEISE